MAMSRYHHIVVGNHGDESLPPPAVFLPPPHSDGDIELGRETDDLERDLPLDRRQLPLLRLHIKSGVEGKAQLKFPIRNTGLIKDQISTSPNPTDSAAERGRRIG